MLRRHVRLRVMFSHNRCLFALSLRPTSAFSWLHKETARETTWLEHGHWVAFPALFLRPYTARVTPKSIVHMRVTHRRPCGSTTCFVEVELAAESTYNTPNRSGQIDRGFFWTS